ncbi:hypothetical protein HZS_7729, partial [Henneguya salminicola]
ILAKDVRGSSKKNDTSEIKSKMAKIFFRCYWDGVANSEDHQIIMWMSPEALSLLRANNSVLTYEKFASMPYPF